MQRVKKFGAVFLALALALAVMAQGAFAAAEYSKLTEDVGTEVAAAVPIALTAVGVFVGIMVAYKLARRMIRA